MRFRSKVVEVDAVQWNGAESWAHVCALMPDKSPEEIPAYMVEESEDNLFIQTLEGTMQARPGDWIIKGLRGELYPCKPDIFAAKYERAPPPPIPQ